MDKKDSLFDKFYDIYQFVLNTQNEDEYIFRLNELCNSEDSCIALLEFSKIPKIKSLIFELENEKLLLSYKMSLLTYIKSNIFGQIALIFQPNIANYPYENIMDNIRSLKKYVFYMNAFNKFPVSFENFELSVDEKNTGQQVIFNSWYEETRFEIIERLYQLTSYFTVNFLLIMGHKKQSSESIHALTYKKLAHFYNKSIDKINNKLIEYQQLCDIYLEVEQSYTTCLILHDTDINLDTFELVIEEND